MFRPGPGGRSPETRHSPPPGPWHVPSKPAYFPPGRAPMLESGNAVRYD